MEEEQMSQVRRPVAAVLSLAATVLVGGVAGGLAANADDAPASVQLTSGTTGAAALPPAAAPVPRPAAQAAPAPKAAPVRSAAAAAVSPVPVPRPGTPAATKLTVPTTVTIQAINKTVGEAQMYRAVFRGVLTATPKKQALPQQSVVLMVRVKGASAWTRAVTAVSSAPDGKLLVAVTQSAPSADYKFVFDAKAPYKASSSGIVTVKRG
jgi:hypothetical protein